MLGIPARVSLLLTLSLALLTLSCGDSSNRVLQSISVGPQTANGQVQFVATGTFVATNWVGVVGLGGYVDDVVRPQGR